MRLGCLFKDQDDDDDGQAGPLNPNKTLEQQIVEGKWKKPLNESTVIRSSSFKRRWCALD
jgi:hypothetical protein